MIFANILFNFNTGAKFLEIELKFCVDVGLLWEIQGGATITWDIVVGGSDLDYNVEFVLIAQGSYTLVVERPRKIATTEEAIHNSFTAKEADKVVLSGKRKSSSITLPCCLYLFDQC
ncbi:hypothetical protein Vadar_032348 [Vaccinium darrowii]|uniref:Uncharacterized protein n=1 Tax=Vaccinium darrowii TaxID=229202 RepID=A0ACB7Z815_9ERIC|nr:hypothetical protein Vadar_032348 [Vaccinium darrowii]